MKNFYLGTALFFFVISIIGASHQLHFFSGVAAIAAAWNFILYKLEC